MTRRGSLGKSKNDTEKMWLTGVPKQVIIEVFAISITERFVNGVQFVDSIDLFHGSDTGIVIVEKTVDMRVVAENLQALS